MHILYIHQYFKTPSEGGGTRSYFIAKEMISRGHKVTMLTSDTNGKDSRIEVVDGMEVIYIPNSYSNNFSIFNRIKSFIGFTVKAIKRASKIKNVDLVYATSTPLTIGYIARYLKAIKKLPYIFEVRDLWPEFPIQMGAIKNSFFIKYLRSFEKRIYDDAIGIVTLSPGMEEGVRKTNTSCKQICMIPNMSKPDIFYPREKNQETLEKFQIDPSAFNVIYFGALGIANGIVYILEAAKQLLDKPNIRFIFLGDGADRIKIEKYIQQNVTSNVSYLGTLDLFTTSDIANCCNASLITFLDIPILYTNSPNKLFDSLSAGLPVIVNSRGWTKDLVEKNQCGFFVEPTSPEDLANKLYKLSLSKEMQNLYSDNARRLSLTTYDKNKLCSELVDFVEFSYAKLTQKYIEIMK
jgi:glycosyltransferase involved in cell wall biosynthesis